MASFSSSQIVFAAVASLLNDHQRFRSLFRVIPSSYYIPASTTQLLREFGWRKMVVITQEGAPFLAVSQLYLKKMCLFVLKLPFWRM